MLAAGLLFLPASCGLLQSAVEAPGKVLNKKSKDKPPSPAVVQTEVMRYTDRFDSVIVQATRDFATQAGTIEARIQGLSWSVVARTAALSIASAPNPYANLLDMLVHVTLARIVHEEHWMPNVWHEADQPMLDAYRELESEIWEIAGNYLDAKQLEEVRAIIEAWREENPEQRATGFVRLPRFERLLASRKDKDRNNVFEDLGKMLSLDPFTGLEPAKREVAEARILGERVLFYGQRAPLIFSAQAELLALKLTRLPAVEDALAKSGRISEAAASLAETAAGLPEAIRSEREETIRQVSEELTRHREGLMRDLESAEAPIGRILGETHGTLDAMRETTGAVESAIQTLDTFLARIEESPADDSGPPGRPFDVREYGEAAARIGEAAKDLDAFLASVDQSEAKTARFLDEVEARSDRSMDRASRKLVISGLILIGVGSAAALAVRWISARWSTPSRTGRQA